MKMLGKKARLQHAVAQCEIQPPPASQPSATKVICEENNPTKLSEFIKKYVRSDAVPCLSQWLVWMSTSKKQSKKKQASLTS